MSRSQRKNARFGRTDQPQEKTSPLDQRNNGAGLKGSRTNVKTNKKSRDGRMKKKLKEGGVEQCGHES